MGPVHSSFVGSFRRKYQFDTVSERQCRKGEEMQPFCLQVNVNKQFNILNLSTRTRERFEQSWTALQRFKTDMCSVCYPVSWGRGRNICQVLAAHHLAAAKQPSLPRPGRHRLSVQASATEQIAEIEERGWLHGVPAPARLIMGKYSLAQMPSRI